MKINALLVALLLGVSSFVPVQAATHKNKKVTSSSSKSHHSKTKRAKHTKKRTHSSKSQIS